MSKQLTISATFSAIAMAAVALFASPAADSLRGATADTATHGAAPAFPHDLAALPAIGG